MVSYHFDETVRRSSLPKAATSRRVPGCENQGNTTPGDVERRAPNKVRLFQVNKSYKICAVTLLIMALAVTPVLGMKKAEWTPLEAFLDKNEVPSADDFVGFMKDGGDEVVEANKIELINQVFEWGTDTIQEHHRENWMHDQTDDCLESIAKYAHFYCMSTVVVYDVAYWKWKLTPNASNRKRQPRSPRRKRPTGSDAIRRLDNQTSPSSTQSPVSIQDIWNAFKVKRQLSEHLLVNMNEVFTSETEEHCNKIMLQAKLLTNDSQTIEFLFEQVIRLTEENNRMKAQDEDRGPHGCANDDRSTTGSNGRDSDTDRDNE
jgi:hypothetical protein